MVISLDLFWIDAPATPDEGDEWLGSLEGSADEPGSSIELAYADIISDEMGEDIRDALGFCGRLSMEYTPPLLDTFRMTLELNFQGQQHRGDFVLKAATLDRLAAKLGYPGYHMTGKMRLALAQPSNVKRPYRRTRSQDIIVDWDKGTSEDVELHFPVLFPFYNAHSPALVYTNWKDFSDALSLLVERRRRLRVM